MNIATIGTSWITEKFISAARTVDDINISAAYSRDEKKAEAFAKNNNIKKHFSDLNKLAGDTQTDSVYIASPNALHYEQSLFFLSHGKNVLCEKPSACTLEQSQKLYEYAEKHNLIFAEAIMSIHTPAFNILKEAISKAGNIYSANIIFCQLSSKYPAFIAGKNPNIFNPELKTGCLMDIGVYNLYFAAALFGKPQKILSKSTFFENGSDYSGASLLCYKNFTACLSYSKAGQSYSPSEIIGDKGTIRIESVSQLTGISFTDSNHTEILVEGNISRDDVMNGEAQFFKNAVLTKNYFSEDYIFAKETSLTVRKMCDEIRSQNGFAF